MPHECVKVPKTSLLFHSGGEGGWAIILASDARHSLKT
jgi:hypothetical protein